MAEAATIPWGATGAMRASKRSSATLERQGQDRGGGSPFALQRAGFWGPCKVVRPCGERRTHRSGEGCPQCNGGSARLKRRLRPTSRRRLPLERICAPYGFVFLCQQKNNIRIQRSQASMGFAKGKARFPFALFWFLLQGQKKRSGGEPCKSGCAKDFATPTGEK